MIGLPYLAPHIIVARPIEVLVSPLSERVLSKSVACSMIAERELGVGFEEL